MQVPTFLPRIRDRDDSGRSELTHTENGAAAEPFAAAAERTSTSSGAERLSEPTAAENAAKPPSVSEMSERQSCSPDTQSQA